MFEWDTAKAAANLAHHGVRFEFAVRVFDDSARVEFDVSRARDGEPRRKCVGHIAGKLYVVVFTMRGGIRRIISARRTNRSEEKRYDDSENDG
jgi:uncharacterized protein